MPKFYFINFVAKFLLFLLFINCSPASENNIKMIDSLIIPDEAPFFDVKGEKHYFDEYDGKAILVVFWASWCSACTKEMPELDNLQKDFRKLPFKIVALSQDYKGIEAVEQFYKSHQLRHLEMFYDQHNSLFKVFDVVGLPSAFLIDANGKVIASFAGIVNWYDSKIRDFIVKYIPGQPAAPKNSYQQNLLDQNTKLNENEDSLVPANNQDQTKNDANDQNKK